MPLPMRAYLTSHQRDVQHFKRPAKDALSDEEKAEIRSAFELFDYERRGRIDYRGLKVLYLACLQM